MNVRVTVDVQTKGNAKAMLERVLRTAGKGGKVKVGFPAGAAPGDLIAIATYNHEGTSRGIPPRPFITQAFFKGRGELRSFMRAEAKAILTGRITPAQSLPRLGLMGQKMIQKQILSNMAPANAPSTIRQKGSSRTLVDSGRMAQSVTWAIE